jgi:phosphoglycolate phosphatase-like HAD superfamily hydrolase
VKHEQAFIPAALHIWRLTGDTAAAFSSIWKHINLYSRQRGINRFAALVYAFQRLQTEGSAAIDASPLATFIDSGSALSAAALAAYTKENPHPFLDTVLAWSAESDTLFNAGVADLQPFTEAMATIQAMQQMADLMVVSSASGAGLAMDWMRVGLLPYTALCAGQETGSKSTQLALSSDGKYPAGHILMVGDAPGDVDAADAAGACFYPIIPGNENDSWRRLREEAFARFTAGMYRGGYEDRLRATFFAIFDNEK